MNENQTQELELAPIAPREPLPLAVSEAKPAMTPAQAKVDAIASLTMQAYEKAATLDLTPEESAALQADFPDEAFKPGAAGKEHLIYIEHAYLRDRFNQVFGLGKWVIIPRNRWAEPFRTAKGTEGSRVYVEAMLVVRGCFVGEAVGAMEYYPKNESQNYGDAVEGAKTAAFRRCAKEFGVGLQAWKKDWCESWWQRRNQGKKSYTLKPEPPKPAVPIKPETEKKATKATLDWMLTELKAYPDQDGFALVRDYAVAASIILDTESLQDWPLEYVPTSKAKLAELSSCIANFERGDPAHNPFKRKITQPEVDGTDENFDLPEDQEPWRTFVMPFGKNVGKTLGELPKNFLFGLWANFKVEQEYQGRPRKPEAIVIDTQLREMLDEAGKHYGFTKSD